MKIFLGLWKIEKLKFAHNMVQMSTPITWPVDDALGVTQFFYTVYRVRKREKLTVKQ